MPTIRKRATGWQAMIRLAGHAPQSQVFDTKAKALAWGCSVEAKLRDQQRGIIKATLQDAIDKYCADVAPTHKGGQNEIKRLQALSKTPGLLPTLRSLPDVTAHDLSKFRDVRLAQVSVATVRKEMTIIRSVFESARRDWGMITINPISDVKKPPAPPNRNRLFVGDEADRILAALDYKGNVTTMQHQVAVALLLAFETGMRAGELLGLTWALVYPQHVTLPETKNGDQRDVPLSTKAIELLQKMKGIDKSTVFTVTAPTMDVLFRRARDKCKIKNLHFHDSRANAITALAKKLDVLDLARMIGHRDIKNLQIYYRKTAADIANRLG